MFSVCLAQIIITWNKNNVFSVLGSNYNNVEILSTDCQIDIIFSVYTRNSNFVITAMCIKIIDRYGNTVMATKCTILCNW